MNKEDQIVYLGRVISLLGRHEQLTLADIRNKSRAFLKKHRQTPSSLFNLMESYVADGHLIRKLYRGRIYYALPRLIIEPPITKVDQVEMGTAFKPIDQTLLDAAKRYAVQKIKEKENG